MEPFPKGMTFREKYDPAMVITDQSEADAYFEQCVAHTMYHGLDPHTRAEAEVIERSNLGYFAGYYSEETRQRVERLFRCAHPILGPIAGVRPPTPEEAFELGETLGLSMKEED